jgi:Xaa-Pro aminopeptidase
MEFMDVGGVRLEDDLVITKDGCELLMHVPRTIEPNRTCYGMFGVVGPV